MELGQSGPRLRHRYGRATGFCPFAASTGDSLAKEQAEATSKEEVLKALSRASSRLRAELGESLPSVQKFDVPIEATTSSLEALKNYSMGITTGRERGDAPSVPSFSGRLKSTPIFLWHMPNRR